jgi:hypothetical protein
MTHYGSDRSSLTSRSCTLLHTCQCLLDPAGRMSVSTNRACRARDVACCATGTTASHNACVLHRHPLYHNTAWTDCKHCNTQPWIHPDAKGECHKGCCTHGRHTHHRCPS